MTLADQVAMAGRDGQVTSSQPERPKRRTFTAAYKARILAEYDALRFLASPGIVGHGGRTLGEIPADGYTERDVQPEDAGKCLAVDAARGVAGCLAGAMAAARRRLRLDRQPRTREVYRRYTPAPSFSVAESCAA